VSDRELRVASASDQGHDGVTDLEPADVRACLDNVSCELQARNVLRCASRSRVMTGNLGQVGAVHACAADAHEQLEVTRPRIWPVGDLGTPAADRHCPDGVTPRRSFLDAGGGVGVPEPECAEECIVVGSEPGVRRQISQPLRIASAEHDVVGLERR
jgi:hypothetical protein